MWCIMSEFLACSKEEGKKKKKEFLKSFIVEIGSVPSKHAPSYIAL